MTDKKKAGGLAGVIVGILVRHLCLDRLAPLPQASSHLGGSFGMGFGRISRSAGWLQARPVTSRALNPKHQTTAVAIDLDIPVA